MGQDVLNECMQAHGGFEHNLQSLRVVDELEQKYVEFEGLNLTFEAREGILKHCSKKNAERLGEVGRRFLFQNLYRHYRVERMSAKARRLLRELFEAFTDNPKLLPPEHRERAETDLQRAVSDYIAGMTDRYAIREHRRNYDIEELA